MIPAAAAAILLIAFAAYHNSFGGPFVFDDRPCVEDNATIRELWPPRLLMPPENRGDTVDGRPLVNFTLAVNYALGGLNVRGYHIFNLAVHIAAALALFGLLRRTFRSPRMEEHVRQAALPLALAAALLWVAHPLQTSAVTYVIQRAESLVSLFYLLTLYCLARSGDSPRSALWQACGVAACLLGALTKEVIATAPVAALLYDRTFLSGSFREALRGRRWFYLCLAATWIVLGFLMLSTGARGETVGFAVGQGGWAYLKAQAFAVFHYLRLVVWPSPLIFDYGETWVTDLSSVVPPGLVVTGLVALSAAALWRWPAAGFAGAFFFLALAPTSSFVPISTAVAEHRVYLALAAPCALLVAAGYAAWRKWAGGRVSTRMMWMVPVTVILVAVTAGAAATVRRNEVYRDGITLWRDTAEKLPGSDRASYSLGVAYQRAGNFEEAISHFEKAARLKPNHDQTYNNLGLSYQATGRLEEALAALEKAAALRPDKIYYQMNLGVALIASGRCEEALKHLEIAADRLPDDPRVLNNLGIALWCNNRPAEAIDLYRRVVRLAPAYTDGLNNLGFALIEQGKAVEALPYLEDAVRLDSGISDIHYNLGRALLGTGDPSRAAEQFTIALELNPEDDVVRRYLENAQKAKSSEQGEKR